MQNNFFQTFLISACLGLGLFCCPSDVSALNNYKGSECIAYECGDAPCSCDDLPGIPECVFDPGTGNGTSSCSCACMGTGEIAGWWDTYYLTS